ncbi:MAG TPA: hypothetical protein VL354_03750 [Spirochaetia bacterium]|nr:hypothetical protein [Spirochaetia bacterium]
MDIQKIKDDVRVGNITQEAVDYLKHRVITEILEGDTVPAANALWAYASFLNRLGITSDNYPLYVNMLASNNRYAIDVLLEGHEPERYLDCVVPNPYIVKAVFDTFMSLKANEIYEKSLRVFLGFLAKVYFAAEEGYQMFPVTDAHVNSLGKFLDKSRDQDWPLNRGILDVLGAIADLDKPHEPDVAKRNVAAQAGRIRSDYFDSARRMTQSITEVILEKAPSPDFGTPPDHIYE